MTLSHAGLSLRVLVALVFALAAPLQARDTAVRRAAYDGGSPKYIFLFIGDGFGETHARAAELFASRTSGTPQQLAMDTLPVRGTMTTHCQDSAVTDSAAAGTALATGRKTTSWTLGMDGTRQAPLRNVSEAARDAGMKVGIITSVPVNHATPASFYAHAPTRDKYYEIGMQLGTSGYEYFAGGGFIQPTSGAANIGQGGADDLAKRADCYENALANGYTVVRTREAFDALAPGAGKALVTVACHDGSMQVPPAMDRKEGDPSLADLVRKGILMLDGEQGFFMMVEGGRIDWQSHANDAAAVVSEVLDFDRAVVEALRFQAAHPLDTLVIVTSDHETGGLRLDETCDIALLARQKGSCDAFAARVAALTVAPASSYEDALATVGDFFGLGRDGLALAPEEDAELRAAFQAVKSGEKPSDPAGAARFQQLYGGCNPLSITASRILARRAGLTWGAYSHTGTPVPIRAMGVGGELFGGEIDNTDVGLGIFLLIERGGEAAEVR